jgi:endo-1,4-beta-xylanase
MTYRSLVGLFVLLPVLVVAGCDSNESPTLPPREEPPNDTSDAGDGDTDDSADTLRVLVNQREDITQIGTAVAADVMLTNDQYAGVLAREFNAVTPENVMKWNPLRPSQDEFDFADADSIVAFAARHDMTVRGHTLVWHRQLPGWLTEGDWTREELITILETHITTVINHYEEEYPGQITKWDVVNEAITDGGGRRSNIWQETIGDDYIAIAFRAAEKATDSDAKLYYNDYGIAGGGTKANAVHGMVSELVEDDVPIDGVGFQSHLSTQYGAPSDQDLVDEMERYQDLGLNVAITELDVRIPLGDDGEASQEQLEQQADYYARFLNTCLFVENCTEFRMWGFTDAHSWVPNEFEGEGAALVFDEQYEPKPAYDALIETLKN